MLQPALELLYILKMVEIVAHCFRVLIRHFTKSKNLGATIIFEIKSPYFGALSEIAQRLGIDTTPDDLSCCGNNCVC